MSNVPRKILSGRVMQTKPIDLYDSNACNQPTKTCGDDWTYGTVKCGALPSKSVCSKVDTTLCPTINGQMATPIFDGAPYVKCEYTDPVFTTADQVNSWTAKFGKDEQYNNVIMPSLCSGQTTKNCKPNSDGLIPASCSNFFSNSEEGTLCNDWKLTNPDLADAAMQIYCSKYNTFECACINKIQYSEYQILSKLTPDDPSCWYKPCSDNIHYYIPANTTSCDDNVAICNNLNIKLKEAIANGQIVNLENLQRVTKCNITNSSNLANNGNTNNNTNSNNSYWWLWILVAIGVLLILYILYRAFRK